MPSTGDPGSFHEEENQTSRDVEYRKQAVDYFEGGYGSVSEKLDNFTKYVSRQRMTSFFARYEIFRAVLKVQGSVVECGVLFGGGLMTWAHLSSIFEPLNYQRKVIGFDTFSGFPELSEEDTRGTSQFCRPGELAVDSYEDLQRCIELYDMNRSLSHIPKIELVRGDARETIPVCLEANSHLVVSLLYLDFDLFEPTRVALEYFVPRMPKGAVIAFDELNSESFPGETVAVFQEIGLRNLRIERFSFDTLASFAVLE